MLWPALSVALAVREEQIAEHGGGRGIRDFRALEAALARPKSHAAYADPAPDIATLAAVLAHAVTSGHPFVDGNKRTSLVLAEGFLDMNGYALRASDAETVATWLDLAAGVIDETALAAWLRERIVPT